MLLVKEKPGNLDFQAFIMSEIILSNCFEIHTAGSPLPVPDSHPNDSPAERRASALTASSAAFVCAAACADGGGNSGGSR